MSFKFTYPDLAANPLLSFGRLRATHTNDTFYGWASIALTGPAFYVAARSSRVQLQHANRLGGKSLSDLLAFGRRAGVAAADYARDASHVVSDPAEIASADREMLVPLECADGENPFAVQDDLQK